jgi:hypothetical protein
MQVVMGWRRLKRKTVSWRLMERYEGMKKNKKSLFTGICFLLKLY